MAAGRNLFAEFSLRFNSMKAAVKDSPDDLVRLYEERQPIHDAARAFSDFLWRTDFERYVFDNERKIFESVPPGFGAMWQDYNERWRDALFKAEHGEEFYEYFQSITYHVNAPVPPDPEDDDSYNPWIHDLGAAIELGIDHLLIEAKCDIFDNYDREAVNSCRIAAGAYDYLVKTMGLDLRAAFRRWREVPVTFMPPHVANHYGGSEKGSLSHLLNDAVRAYVFGAPAAAIAMCRAALEVVLKEHYLPDQKSNLDLGELIVLADRRYDFVQKAKVDPIRRKANAILHGYHKTNRLSEEDERTIVNYLKTVKFLIQRAPKR